MCRISSKQERREIRTLMRQNSRFQLYVESRLKAMRRDLAGASKRFGYLCDDFAEVKYKANVKAVIAKLAKRLEGMLIGLCTFDRGVSQLRAEAAGSRAEDYSADFDNLLEQSDDLHGEMLAIKDELASKKAESSE